MWVVKETKCIPGFTINRKITVLFPSLSLSRDINFIGRHTAQNRIARYFPCFGEVFAFIVGCDQAILSIRGLDLHSRGNRFDAHYDDEVAHTWAHVLTCVCVFYARYARVSTPLPPILWHRLFAESQVEGYPISTGHIILAHSRGPPFISSRRVSVSRARGTLRPRWRIKGPMLIHIPILEVIVAHCDRRIDALINRFFSSTQTKART